MYWSKQLIHNSRSSGSDGFVRIMICIILFFYLSPRPHKNCIDKKLLMFIITN